MHDPSRRKLTQWSLATGAALGLSRTRVAEVLERTCGVRTAEAATAVTTKRSVHIRAGNGGLAWFTQMWPHPQIAPASTATNKLAWFSPGGQQAVLGW